MEAAEQREYGLSSKGGEVVVEWRCVREGEAKVWKCTEVLSPYYARQMVLEALRFPLLLFPVLIPWKEVWSCGRARGRTGSMGGA